MNRFIENGLIRIALKGVRCFPSFSYNLNEQLLSRYSNSKIKYQPIFIIGAPRTGSTILYQSLTNNYEVCYLNNFIANMYKIPILGMYLSRLIFGKTPHNNFHAKQGITTDFGWRAPSECGEFWYRWLPRSKHFIDKNDIGNEDQRRIRNEIVALTNCSRRPIVLKNLNAGQRLRLIAQILPEAKFIWIRRDPIFTAWSILRCKSNLSVHPDEWWSIMPKNVNQLRSLPPCEQALAQVYFLEKQIEKDLRLFDVNNHNEIWHNDLSKENVCEIAKWLNLKSKNYQKWPKFKKDLFSNIPDEMSDKLNCAKLRLDKLKLE